MTALAHELARAADALLEDDLRDHHDRCSQQHSPECSCGHTQHLTNALRAAIDTYDHPEALALLDSEHRSTLRPSKSEEPRA